MKFRCEILLKKIQAFWNQSTQKYEDRCDPTGLAFRCSDVTLHWEIFFFRQVKDFMNQMLHYNIPRVLLDTSQRMKEWSTFRSNIAIFDARTPFLINLSPAYILGPVLFSRAASSFSSRSIKALITYVKWMNMLPLLDIHLHTALAGQWHSIRNLFAHCLGIVTGVLIQNQTPCIHQHLELFPGSAIAYLQEHMIMKHGHDPLCL